MWFYHRGIHPKDADRMANSVDPDQTAPSAILSTLLCQNTVQKYRIIILYNPIFPSTFWFKVSLMMWKRKIIKWNTILAYQIRKSKVFAWDRNSYLTQKRKFSSEFVCIGCIGRHATLSLGWRHCYVTMTSNLKMSYISIIVCGYECYF